MPSLHMLGHMVAMAVIATLVKQIMELNAQVNKLQNDLDNIKESPGCFNEIIKGNERTDDSTDDDKESMDGEGESDKLEKENVVNDSFEKEEFLTDDIYANDEDILEHSSVYSSVWCHDGFNQVCQFENICYSSEADEFVLFKHESSVFENVKEEHGSITLDLSSVKDHNGMETSIVSLPSSALSNFKTKWVNETTLVFTPFLSDNLMHMFHDDIIPLHHTLKLITMGNNHHKDKHPFEVQLLIYDNEFDVDDEVKQFYEVFSRFKIKSKQDFKGNILTCFTTIFIGLSRATTWYDYGFSSPQGPIKNGRVESAHIKSTVNYLRQHLPLPLNLNPQEYVVLFSRKENRKMINEVELTMKILRTSGIKVMNLNFESFTLLELISYSSYSTGVIAMHGSLLILSMFLKPGSFVIELYPYAINPSNYKPYKTLSQLRGMGLIYKAWVNQIKEYSIGHPDWPAELGGLSHLAEDERETILHQTQVPPHLCCNDPSWLYHIYQDTVVNSSEISALVQDALSESVSIKESVKKSENLLYPSKVQNVFCHISYTDNSGKQESKENRTRFLTVKWDIPWTTYYMEFESLHYEILFQSLDSDADTTLTFKSTDNKFVIDSKCSGRCYVWVKAVMNDNITGLFSKATLCKLD